MWKIVFDEAVNKDETTCPICLADYKEDEQIDMTSCGHFYHSDCIFEWFEKAGSNFDKCPKCRAEFEISIHPEVAELNEKLKKVDLGFEMKTVGRMELTDSQLEILRQLGYTI